MKIDSYTIHVVGGLPDGMAETIIPQVPARHPLLVRGHVRGSTHWSCHGYLRRRFRPRVVQVIPVPRSVSYDQSPCPPLPSSPFLFSPFFPGPDQTSISDSDPVVFFNSQYLSSVLLASGEVSCAVYRARAALPTPVF
jgi:hypothetical protein